MKEQELYQEVVSIIRNEINNQALNSDMIAQKLGVNRMYLHRKLKAHCNMNAGELIQTVRVKVAKEMLHQDKQKIAQVAKQVGFSDNSYFTKTFKKITGQTPSVFKKSKV